MWTYLHEIREQRREESEGADGGQGDGGPPRLSCPRKGDRLCHRSHGAGVVVEVEKQQKPYIHVTFDHDGRTFRSSSKAIRKAILGYFWRTSAIADGMSTARV